MLTSVVTFTFAIDAGMFGIDGLSDMDNVMHAIIGDMLVVTGTGIVAKSVTYTRSGSNPVPYGLEEEEIDAEEDAGFLNG